MGLALAVPIVANGIRAMGIVVAAEYLGSAEAAAADHVIYGWGFFSAVILLLILAGLPFREDSAPPAARRAPDLPARPARTGALVAAGVLAVALTAAGPGLAAGLAHGAGAPAEIIPRLAAPENCHANATGTELACGGVIVSARILVFSPRVTWSAVNAARWQVGGSDTVVTYDLPIAGGGAWQVRQGNARIGTVALASWLDGRPVGHGIATRLAQARNSLVAGSGAPVLVLVTLRGDPAQRVVEDGRRDRALLEAVLAAQGGGLVTEAATLSRGR
jgi:hypothetical protein